MKQLCKGSSITVTVLQKLYQYQPPWMLWSGVWWGNGKRRHEIVPSWAHQQLMTCRIKVLWNRGHLFLKTFRSFIYLFVCLFLMSWISLPWELWRSAKISFEKSYPALISEGFICPWIRLSVSCTLCNSSFQNFSSSFLETSSWLLNNLHTVP